ncbi:spectrin beta chain isoform X3 [Ixodes scapularis]|uniref:spectrin beta chain isoform X3 n=1 Tax=Ixodes scapularis TaxID=6945 RepID=UPI0011615625|nr:spectrin beta chain isoform X3 [Ixodes scapularis]
MTTDISVGIRWDPSTANQQEMEDYDYDGGNSSSRLFERSRIKALAEEREMVQKKTFCKWVNSHLVRANCRITDLTMDMRDGKMLIKLLEILSGEKLQKPTKGKMKIHCLENVDKALTFLKEQRVHLENLGSHDIVDGNSRLTLGLIWTIILRFQIQDITIEQVDNQETKSAKDALLLWCQMKTAGYPNVNVRNFTTSWRDGLAFNALIHKHRPDLIQYEKLSKSNAIYNLNNAFNTAEQKLGLTRLLDPEDVFVDNPDEKSIITYVVTYYHYFSKMKAETVQGKRIGKVVGCAMENDRSIEEYDTLTSDLLRWIEQTIEALSDRNFANSLVGVQQQLLAFNTYRTAEKPKKFEEKGNLEVLLFALQSKMRANNQKPYFPREGKMISDINRAWERLEKAEHERELALREELIRQEKLEQLAARFDRKAGMRETWLSENQRLVSQDNFGTDLASAEAAAKKHEAIETDILAYEERVQAVVAVARELEAEGYHDVDRINARKDNVLRLWNYLLELLRARRARLEGCLTLQQTFQEMLYIVDCMEELKGRLASPDLGKHLMGVEDLLQKHSLLEADVNVLGERVKAVVGHAQGFLGEEPQATGAVGPDGRPLPADQRSVDPRLVAERTQQLEGAYSELVRLALERRKRLEDSRRLWQFYWDMAEEEAWIQEKDRILSSLEIGHDLTMVHLLISKNKAMEDELAAHEQQLMEVVRAGESLVAEGQPGSERVSQRTAEVLSAWDHLRELQALRAQRLAQALDFHQFFADADDVDTWMLDTLMLVSSDDVGRDEANVQSLLKKHKDVMEELKSYTGAIDALHAQADALGPADRESPAVLERLASIDHRYKDLLDLARLRKQRLLDALSLHKLFNEADGVHQWIQEKDKMLESMVLTRDAEDTEVMRHRFEGFEQEMNGSASRVAVVNQLARQLLHVEHPNSEQVLEKQNALNQSWAALRDAAEKKRENISSAHGVQTFHVECRETITWIEEKTKLLQATEDLGDDLTGIMTLQRRLSGMERDLAAIQAKLDALDKEAERIKQEHPEEADAIQERILQIKTVWEQLTQLLKERDAKLEEAGDLHRFLRDLDHFQAWLTKTQTEIASEDEPTSLQEAERLLEQHRLIRQEVDNYTDDYAKMMEYGERITADAADEDPQYMFLRERLRALRDGWAELTQMWENRQALLSQSLNLQLFQRDAKQAEVLLSRQEHHLSKDETPTSLEQVEDLMKRHEAFLTTMEANDEKINAVVQYAQRLCNEGHFASDKIRKKADSILERRDANRNQANDQMAKLADQHALHQFLQDCDQLNEWVQEKSIIAQDETYRSAKTVHSKWTRHQAFEAEVQSNKDRLYQVQQAGRALVAEKPEMAQLVEPKLAELGQQFAALEDTTKEKGLKLFDANRQVLYEQTCDDIDSWIDELESQVLVSETGQDLTSVNLILQRQKDVETQMAQKARQVDELQNQATYLQKLDPQKTEDIIAKRSVVEQRFERLQAPLMERRNQLLKKKEAYQFRRDVEDEKLWVREKMPLAQSPDRGASLFGVQMLRKKEQSLRNEVDNHEPRIVSICENGRKLVAEGHEDAAEFDRLVKELEDLWAKLRDALDARRRDLLVSEKAHQYYFDASEAEAWMSEQELYMMVEDRGRDEISAQNLRKKHQNLEGAVDDYADTVRQLGDTARRLVQEEHPDSDQITVRQSQVDKLYAGLKDLALERRQKLEEALRLFGLNREVDDLMQWIAEREVVASSQELGQDYEHVTLLRERFNAFRDDTKAVGEERVQRACAQADALMSQQQGTGGDAATAAQWKDTLQDAWADLLELMDTRAQVLAASWDLHRFFHDCKDVHQRILEKQNSMSDELGRDAVSVQNLQRRQANFENDLQTLGSAVEAIQGQAAQLGAAYAGDKAREIQSRESEVVAAWQRLLGACDGRRARLADTGDLFRFLCMVRDLLLWMEDVVRQMNTSEKPRDVSGVELLMNNHQSLKAEVDAREDNLSSCVALGKELLARGHYASGEIKEKLLALTTQRSAMMARWDERWEHLQLILEVYQFARDAAVAEHWLVAQEPYLLSQELGHAIDEVEQLIKKHEAFEKSAAAQEERFAALERLTTFELKEMRAREEEQERQRQQEEMERLAALQPPPSHEPSQDRVDAEASAEAVREQPVLNGEQERHVGEQHAEVSGSRSPAPHATPSAATASRSAPSTPTPPKDKKKRSRSKSPFGSWRRKKSPLDDSDEAAFSEKLSAPTDEDGQFEGLLLRKHEWESTTKKASNRSWEKVYVVIRGAVLAAYKDQKHYKQEPESHYRNEPPIDLRTATAEVAADYTKKKHVFRLKLSNGGEFLFQGRDDEEMGQWLQKVQAAIGEAEGSAGPSRAQTLPAERKDEPKKRSFFTLKKN